MLHFENNKAILYRDFLRSEKKTIRQFFKQTTKAEDAGRRIEPHSVELGLILDWTRLKRNLELWKIVNHGNNKPTLKPEEMYGLLQAFGENFDGVINIESFTALVRKFSLIWLKNEGKDFEIAKQKTGEGLSVKDSIRLGKGAGLSTESFVKSHWPNRVGLIGE